MVAQLSIFVCVCVVGIPMAFYFTKVVERWTREAEDDIRSRINNPH